MYIRLNVYTYIYNKHICVMYVSIHISIYYIYIATQVSTNMATQNLACSFLSRLPGPVQM